MFRRDNKAEGFEQQMGALRDQLGSTGDLDEDQDEESSYQDNSTPYAHLDVRNQQPYPHPSHKSLMCPQFRR